MIGGVLYQMVNKMVIPQIKKGKETISTLEPIEYYVSRVSNTLENLPVESIARVIEVLRKARNEGARIYVMGNGGSATTASHFAGDLSKGANADGKPRIKIQALVDNIASFSAWANDTSYENVFAEQLENYVEPDDVVIGISGSGNSGNILNGMKLASLKGARTIGLTGFEGGKLKDTADICVIVPSDSMEQIEDIHLLLCHLITYTLREY